MIIRLKQLSTNFELNQNITIYYYLNYITWNIAITWKINFVWHIKKTAQLSLKSCGK